MAVLTRHELSEALRQERIVLTPPIDAFQMQPHAIDLRLGYTFYVPRNWRMTPEGRRAITISVDDPREQTDSFEEIVLKPGQFFELLPNEFVIATSLERIEIRDLALMAILFPRTSTNRRGIDLSLSGIIDTGYNGTLIFPMKNEAGNQVIRLYPGERICQILFEDLARPLSQAEAKAHGMAHAKYTHQTSGLYRLDKQEELEAILSGQLPSLKQRFPLKPKLDL